ncbi:MAG: ribonuclease III, partial [Oscillospiraceae bacterium]|nr:ribonuclease III [Oscillospiraceae bacterium]
MKQLEKNIGYHFRNKELLKTAVTHSSFANENRGGMAYNERLEFLGDAVLQLVTSEKLFTEN